MTRNKAYADLKDALAKELALSTEQFIDAVIIEENFVKDFKEKLDKLNFKFKHIRAFYDEIREQILEIKKLGDENINRPTFTAEGVKLYSSSIRKLISYSREEHGIDVEVSPNSQNNLTYFADMVNDLWVSAYHFAKKEFPFSLEYQEKYKTARTKLLLLHCRNLKKNKPNVIPAVLKKLDTIYADRPSIKIDPSDLLQLAVRCTDTVQVFFPGEKAPPLGYLSFLIQPHKDNIEKNISYLTGLNNLEEMASRPFAVLAAGFLAHFLTTSQALDKTTFDDEYAKLERAGAPKTQFLQMIDCLERYHLFSKDGFEK